MHQYLSPKVHIPFTPAISHFIPFFSIKISFIILLCELFHLFYYQGFGCKAKQMDWNEEDQQWIYGMDKLFTNLFGLDSCEYEYTEKKHSVVVPGQFPQIQCQHKEWEKTIKNDIPRPAPQQHRAATKIKLATAPKTATSPQQLDSSSTATMSYVTAASITAPKVFNNTVATSAGRSTKQGDPIRTSDPDSEAPSQNVLRLDGFNLPTRGEIVALALPRVASISSNDIMHLSSKRHNYSHQEHDEWL